MPCRLPLGVVSGVLKSAWASSQSTARRRPAAAQCRAMPLIVPMEIEWSPPRKTGTPPASAIS